MLWKNKIKVKYLLLPLQAGVSFLILFYLMKILDWNTVLDVLDSGLIFKLWPAVLILIFGIFLAASRWSLLLNSLQIVVTKLQAFWMYLSGTFYGVFLPGVLGGDVVRAGLCAVKTTGSMKKIFLSVVVERVLGVFGLTLLGTVALLTLNPALRDALGWQVLVICPGMSMGMILGFVLIRALLPSINRPSKRESWLGRRLTARINEFITPMSSFSPHVLVSTLILGTAFQASEIIVFIFFSYYLRIDVPPVLFFAIVPVVYIATTLPVSLGGIGVREGVLVWLLTKVGVVASDAVLLAFLIYLNRIAVALTGGLVQWIRLPGHGDFHVAKISNDTETKRS